MNSKESSPDIRVATNLSLCESNDRKSLGESNALGTLYERHGESVYRTAYRIMGSHDDAEDVLQEVFIGLPEFLVRFEERGSLEGWIRRIAARVSLAKLRKQRRRAELSLQGPRPTGPEPSDTCIDRAALDFALRQLPEKLRLVFVLREVEGYSHAEIAEMLGIRPGTSEVRLHRAKDLLRQLLRST